MASPRTWRPDGQRLRRVAAWRGGLTFPCRSLNHLVAGLQPPVPGRDQPVACWTGCMDVGLAGRTGHAVSEPATRTATRRSPPGKTGVLRCACLQPATDPAAPHAGTCGRHADKPPNSEQHGSTVKSAMDRAYRGA